MGLKSPAVSYPAVPCCELMKGLSLATCASVCNMSVGSMEPIDILQTEAHVAKLRPFISSQQRTASSREEREEVAKVESSYGSSRWVLIGMNALVTGGTRGIGHAIVEELAELGATVHTCSRKEAELNHCLQEWTGKGFAVTGSLCDVSSQDQRLQLMENVSSLFTGKLNILINNVGTNIIKKTAEYTAEEYSKLMATNFESTYHLCQLAYPLVKASGVGSIVFISSVAGLVHTSSGSIYGATKGNHHDWSLSVALV
ncbi:tropinone reductase homolog At5g06060-like [Cornus florida]|uniref:tropinone reductase homolog At5g06060-like n=1 Tax=Cornus florida TaxID=4283 RepID=UPI00289F4516|nr:tropinone reductase homolog At5g06060-like [Cornus florida]